MKVLLKVTINLLKSSRLKKINMNRKFEAMDIRKPNEVKEWKEKGRGNTPLTLYYVQYTTTPEPEAMSE